MCRACNDVPESPESPAKREEAAGAREAAEAQKAQPEAQPAEPPATDLRHFHPARGSFEQLPRGEFTEVRRIAQGINGEVFRYRWAWMGNDGEHVAVKKLRREAAQADEAAERDERKAHFRIGGRRAPAQEDALTEIGVLTYLFKQADLPVYLLKMMGVFADIRHTWLVTELADGGELFGAVQRRGALPEAQAKRYSWEMFQAVSYLHRHRIGHRDLSLENVLLKDGVVRVMDFGMAVRSHAECGEALRFFMAVGKDFYRAPECYVPAAPEVYVVVPEAAAPGDVVCVKVNSVSYSEVLLPPGARPWTRCRARVWGYEAAPTDVFAMGVCMSIMLSGNPPWDQANLADSRFEFVHKQGLCELLRQWGMPLPSPDVEELLGNMTRTDPSRRWSVDECLASPWFAELADAKVPTHSRDLSAEPMRLRTLAGA